MSEENFLNAFRKKLDQKQCHTEGNDDVTNTNTNTKTNITTTITTTTNPEDNTITDNTVVPKGRVSHYMKKNILPKELLEEFKKEKPTTEHHHKETGESQFEKEKKSSIADIVQDPNNYFSSGTNKDDNTTNTTNNNVNPIITTTSTTDFKSKLNMFNTTTPSTSESTSTSKNKLLSHLRQVQQVPSSTTAQQQQQQPSTTLNTYNIRTQISTEPRQSVRDLLKLNEERLKLLQDEKDERERRDSVKQKNREAWKLRMQKLSEFIRNEKDPNESDKDFYEDNIEVLKEYGITNFKDFKETLAFFENANTTSNYAKQRNSSYFPKNPLSKAELAKITEEIELNQIITKYTMLIQLK